MAEVFKGLKEVTEEARKESRGIKEIRIDEVNIKGAKAVVEFSSVLKDGNIEKGACKLIKERGKWKMDEPIY